MTDDELAEHEMNLLGPLCLAKRAGQALAIEVRRLRALPVIATCGACAWCGPSSGGWSCDHPRSIAAVQRAAPGCPQGGHVGHDAPPPADCPLRGAP